MSRQVVRGFNRKKYKAYYQNRLNLSDDLSLGFKLKRQKWSFLRFSNSFKFFPKFKSSKLKFFFRNILSVRRFLRFSSCRLSSSSLKKVYRKASKGHPKYLRFLNLLESRLDLCLYRTGLFKTPSEVRQFILHRNVYLNGVCVSKPGLCLSQNDLVQLDFSVVDLGNLSKSRFESVEDAAHLEVNYDSLAFIYLGFFSKSRVPFVDSDHISFLNYIFRG